MDQVPGIVGAVAGERLYSLGDPETLSAGDLVAAYNDLGNDEQLRGAIRDHLPGLAAGAVDELSRRIAWAATMQRWFEDCGVEAVDAADAWEFEFSHDAGRLLKVAPGDYTDREGVARENSHEWRAEVDAIWARAVRDHAGRGSSTAATDFPHASGAW